MLNPYSPPERWDGDAWRRNIKESVIYSHEDTKHVKGLRAHWLLTGDLSTRQQILGRIEGVELHENHPQRLATTSGWIDIKFPCSGTHTSVSPEELGNILPTDHVSSLLKLNLQAEKAILKGDPESLQQGINYLVNVRDWQIWLAAGLVRWRDEQPFNHSTAVRLDALRSKLTFLNVIHNTNPLPYEQHLIRWALAGWHLGILKGYEPEIEGILRPHLHLLPAKRAAGMQVLLREVVEECTRLNINEYGVARASPSETSGPLREAALRTLDFRDAYRQITRDLRDTRTSPQGSSSRSKGSANATVPQGTNSGAPVQLPQGSTTQGKGKGKGKRPSLWDLPDRPANRSSTLRAGGPNENHNDEETSPTTDAWVLYAREVHPNVVRPASTGTATEPLHEPSPSLGPNPTSGALGSDLAYLSPRGSVNSQRGSAPSDAGSSPGGPSPTDTSADESDVSRPHMRTPRSYPPARWGTAGLRALMEEQAAAQATANPEPAEDSDDDVFALMYPDPPRSHFLSEQSDDSDESGSVPYWSLTGRFNNETGFVEPTSDESV